MWLIDTSMFEYLKGYRCIFVSGMQRSGTTICARMIQWDLKISTCYWAGVKTDRIERYFNNPNYLFTKYNPLLLHSPGPSHCIHEYTAEDVAIIWMKREVEDVMASAKKVPWNPTRRAFSAYGIKTGSVLGIENKVKALYHAKQNYWEKTQKFQIKNWYEVEYESLAEHPLWLGKEDRGKKLKTRQIKPGGTLQGELEHLKRDYPEESK